MSVTAVILAAGFSTRMEGPNKLLEEVGGVPIIRRVADAVVPVCSLPPVVILGRDPKSVSEALDGLDLRPVRNQAPDTGQAASVELGLRAAPDATATLVVPGDQPFLTEEALKVLLLAHGKCAESRITVPMQGDTRGNPIVLPRKYRAQILAEGKNTGCQAFTRNNPHLINRFETNDRAFFFDVDTPTELADAKLAFLTEAEQWVVS